MFDAIARLARGLRERLWFRPLAMGILSVLLVFLATLADQGRFADVVPDITESLIESLLKILSTSMLVIATFAVGSMVAAYASAARTATPRSFPLVVADDVSQNALSGFIGSFIFSIVALSVLLHGVYGEGGRFALFVITLLVFAGVILTFVRWVDRIARLGRLGSTIDKAEKASRNAFLARLEAPTLGGVPFSPRPPEGPPIHSERIGYVQRLDMERLQQIAEQKQGHIVVTALPGTFSMSSRPLGWVSWDGDDEAKAAVAACFEIADDRNFDDDPRFGLIVLSEIVSRALSPAVNDPGTAIDIIGTFVRLFDLWADRQQVPPAAGYRYDRVEVPRIDVGDMFDDAFTGVARDGADTVEVGIRLQKALAALAKAGGAEMRAAAKKHARLAMTRAVHADCVPEDLEAIRAAGMLAHGGD